MKLKVLAVLALCIIIVLGYFYLKSLNDYVDVFQELRQTLDGARRHKALADQWREKAVKLIKKNAELERQSQEARVNLQAALDSPIIKYIPTGTDNDKAFEQAKQRLNLCLEYSNKLANQVLSLQETITIKESESIELRLAVTGLNDAFELQAQTLREYKKRLRKSKRTSYIVATAAVIIVSAFILRGRSN